MKLNDEQQKFIKNNVVGKTSRELTILFNKKFGTNVSNTTIINFKKKHKLKSGVSTKFEKGNVPYNYKKVGSEFINSNGYTEIKIADPKVWELKHRYLYKRYKGDIPDDCCVIFKDGNKQNFNLDNLVLIKIKDKLVMKNKHLFFNNKNLTQTGILIAKLINKKSELERVKLDERI